MIYLKGPETKQIGAKNVQLRGDAQPYTLQYLYRRRL